MAVRISERLFAVPNSYDPAGELAAASPTTVLFFNEQKTSPAPASYVSLGFGILK